MSDATASFNTGKQITFVPKHAVSVWGDYNAHDLLRGLSFGGGLVYQSHLFNAYTAPNPATYPLGRVVEIPETVELDAVIAYEIDRLRFQLNINNLTDRLNYSQSFGNRGTPAPGRTFIFSVGANSINDGACPAICLTPDQVAQMRGLMAKADWVDGKVTAGSQSGQAQAQSPDPGEFARRPRLGRASSCRRWGATKLFTSACAGAPGLSAACSTAMTAGMAFGSSYRQCHPLREAVPRHRRTDPGAHRSVGDAVPHRSRRL